MDRSQRLKLLVKAPRCPVLYGLPKVHKDGVPLRPVVSFVDAPTYLVAKELARILEPLFGNTASAIGNSEEICKFLHELSIGDEWTLVSYDVNNLFGSAPAEEAVEMTLLRLQEDVNLKKRTSLSMESIRKLLYFCIRSNYFVCNGMYFRTSTCPMGSPLSPALAAIFMEVFEDGVLKSTKVQIKTWKRYVDDTLVIVRTGQEGSLLEELNAIVMRVSSFLWTKRRTV
jgi:hypothetical protein